MDVQLNELLVEYVEEIQQIADKNAQKCARDAAKVLKTTSPQSEGHTEYAGSWGVKADKDTHTFTTWNRKHWQLTHLLENGHEIFSHGVSTGKRTRANRHIENAAEQFSREFVEKTEREIK